MEKLKAFLRRRLADKLLLQTAKRGVLPAAATLATAYVTAEPLSPGRILLCMAGVLLLPVLFFAPVRTLVARRSNAVNALLLGGFTLADLLLGFVSVRGRIGGWMSALVVAVFTLGGFFYDVGMMSFALRLEKN